MRRLILPLAISLGIVLAVSAGAFLRTDQPESPGQAPPLYTTAGSGSAPLETQAPPTTTAEPLGRAGDQPTGPATEGAIKTGCGKATPCPGRSCEDCPLNRLLK